MKVVEPVEDMQDICMRLVRRAKSIRLVPTMGALHAGHGSLIKRAIEDEDDDDAEDEEQRPRSSVPVTNGNGNCATGQSIRSARRDKVVASVLCAGDLGEEANKEKEKQQKKGVTIVSIFVNPIQFNDPNDLERYPKTLESDLEMCRALGVDFVFVPKCSELFPAGGRHTDDDSSRRSLVNKEHICTLGPPSELATCLEGKSRGAGHFEGMLTIVNKLFNITQPRRAYFGEKDFQQLVLVECMCRDLNIRIRICPVETVREPDTNLPLSSRNVHLNLEQRHLAAQMMSETLFSTKQALEEKCRRGAPQATRANLDSLLLASMMTSHLVHGIREDDITDHLYREDRHLLAGGVAPASVVVDYFELRCAKDLTVIHFDEDKNLYDCQMGCSCNGRNSDLESGVLETRLLMSIMISKVRLLDNVGVRLNT